MSPYKILVVDDSAFMRKIISDLITEDPQFEVIDTARNGREAVDKARNLKPDVITMDVEMPVMNGLEALQIIMKEHPIPVVMLSSMTGIGTEETIRALELGAVDFIRKPSGSISLDLYKVKHTLIEKLKISISAKIQSYKEVDHPALPQTAAIPMSGPPFITASGTVPFRHLVAIGTSTGGPKALQTVLTGLPEWFQAPILVVQHMPPNFTKSLSIRLDTYCSLQVVEAEDGMEVCVGTVYIAPGGWHMRISGSSDRGYRIRLDKEEPRFGHRPSVDVLFESCIPIKQLKRHAVIMTGMGSDGAKALKSLKESGAYSTIAESEETCIVYGMPRAAIELKGVDYILKLQDIPGKLVDLVHGTNHA